MLVDTIETDNGVVKIYIINLIDHDLFSIYALNALDEKVQGLEIRIKKPFKMDLLEFSLQPHASSLVNLLRRQIEDFGLEPWGGEVIDVKFQLKDSIDDLRRAGRNAFAAGRHYRINPFDGLNTFRYEEWQAGWMEEAKKYPARFDFEKNVFIEEQ